MYWNYTIASDLYLCIHIYLTKSCVSFIVYYDGGGYLILIQSSQVEGILMKKFMAFRVSKDQYHMYNT